MPQKGNEEDEPVCPGCGAPESQWIGLETRGFINKNGELSCCKDCAEGRICKCLTERLEALVKSRTA